MDEITTPLPPVPLEVIEDKPGVTSSGNPLGRAVHSKAVEDYELLTPKEQHEALRTTWRAVAYGIASRARTYAANCSAKDFGKLYQLVQAGATSLDKAFPPREQAQSTKLVFNLFNSLGQRAARIAIPETPIDITPKDEK